MTEKGRILTGHRPPGPRHIGHLVGTLENWVRLQNDYECFFLINEGGWKKNGHLSTVKEAITPRLLSKVNQT